MNEVKYGISLYLDNGEELKIEGNIEELKAIKDTIEEFLNKIKSHGVEI